MSSTHSNQSPKQRTQRMQRHYALVASEIGTQTERDLFARALHYPIKLLKQGEDPKQVEQMLTQLHLYLKNPPRMSLTYTDEGIAHGGKKKRSTTRKRTQKTGRKRSTRKSRSRSTKRKH